MNKETVFLRTGKTQEQVSESCCEYVLPDYNSDVRKILFTKAVVRPSNKFTGSDEVELSGIVVYDVIYSDTEGKISHTSFTSDYDFSVKYKEESVENVIFDTRVSSFAVRLLSPRKFSAKASLCSGVKMIEQIKYLPEGNAFEKESPELLKKTFRVRNIMQSDTVEREYAEMITAIDGAIEDELKAIYRKAEIVTESLSADDGRVNLRGELYLTAVIQNGDEPAYFVEKTVPIEEEINLSVSPENTKLTPVVLISSENVTINPTDSGCEVVMNVIADISVRVEKNEEVELLLDSYSTFCPTNNGYSDFNYLELIDVIKMNDQHTAEILRSDVEEGRIKEIIFMDAQPKIDSVLTEKDGVRLLGEIKYSGIASEINDDGSVSYSSIKHTAPFEEKVNNCCQNKENVRVDAKVSTSRANAKIDGNKIYLEAGLFVEFTLSEESSEKILVSSVLCEDEKYESGDSKIVAYYPDEGESLFSIAKKFHTSVERLAKLNPIAEEVSLSESANKAFKRLLIW